MSRGVRDDKTFGELLLEESRLGEEKRLGLLEFSFV